MHELAPGNGENLPLGHSAHRIELTLCDPAEQSTHSGSPLLVATLPAAHSVHELALVPAEKPLGHSVHWAEPVLLYFPAIQPVHVVEPTAAAVPAAHS